MSLSFSYPSIQIPTRILPRRGKGNAERLIDIPRLGTILGEDVCQAMIGVHAHIGCDSVSAFGGQGKIKPLIWSTRAMNADNCSHHLDRVQAFTCNMYCSNTNTKLVNKLRYEMFCAKNGDISFGQLPPCSDALRQYAHHANYQAAIWRRSLESSPTVPSPTDGHGWNILDEQLEICWLTGAPAPEVVLELMSCRCSSSRRTFI